MRNFGAVVVLLLAGLCGYSQVPIDVGVQILRAEDSRRYDPVLENLMRSPNASIRERAALAAGRIGDDKAIPALAQLLDKDPSEGVRAMAAFAIGEVESINGAPALLRAALMEYGTRTGPGHPRVLARIVEAEGKVAAANPKDPQTKELGASIVYFLKGMPSEFDVARLALTAALRARPEGATAEVVKFLKDRNPRLRADALNTLARLRAKEKLTDIRGLLGSDPDATVRANAARVLGGAEDKDSLEPLVNAATKDSDVRVRAAAIRALASLKDPKAVPFLIARGNALLTQIKTKSAARKPVEQNELLEIATAVGQLMKGTSDLPSIRFLNEMLRTMYEPEVTTALARVAPSEFMVEAPPAAGYRDLHVAVAYARGLAAVAETKDNALVAQAGEKLATFAGGMANGVPPADQQKMIVAMPELTSAMAELKPDNIDEILRGQLENGDPFIRAAAAGAIADRPKSNDNIAALKSSFSKSFVLDKHDDDAMLAVLDALYKLDKEGAVGSLLVALSSPDYLVRKKAFEMLGDPEIQKASPGVITSLENARNKHRDQVLQYSPASATRLGQVLNTDADYHRALMRKNGTVRAVLTTEKGTFTIEFNPEEAPLTVDNWVKLARAGYFNGLEVHRVVPNFVVQDGDPRGDGSGGPGWSIRCEINMLPYDRGAVGMALSGKDTGGSQWFVTHSPQPHLDGGYTVFGHVSENDMAVADSIVRGDRIIKVAIIESASTRVTPRTKRGR